MSGYEIIVLIFVALNTVLVWVKVSYDRKKDFEDQLFKLKFTSYQDLSEQCYKAYQTFDINSTPFTEIYDYKTEPDWSEYWKREIYPLYKIGFELRDNVYRHAIHLPNGVLDDFLDFSNDCLSFVTVSVHFEIKFIIDKQDELWDKYINILNTIRSDLKIHEIDKSLGKRMKERLGT